jgi:hypothetical protein
MSTRRRCVALAIERADPVFATGITCLPMQTGLQLSGGGHGLGERAAQPLFSYFICTGQIHPSVSQNILEKAGLFQFQIRPEGTRLPVDSPNMLMV